MQLPIANAVLPTSGVRSYLYQRSATHKHRGIDLPAKKGTPVRAVAAGRVRHAYSTWRQGFTGYGRVVVVEHPGPVWTLYAHLDTVYVAPGEVVTAGQRIGTVGNSVFSRADKTRESGGAHLHFEVSPRPYPQQSEADRIDPVAWLRQLGQEVTEAASVPFDAPASPASPAAPSSRSLPCPHCGGSLVLAAGKP